jgi:pimeloyl-ACP methyl ester carboxylesterase
MMSRWSIRAALCVAGLTLCSIAAAIDWEPCRLKGLAHEALCGSVRRPLDPARPGGTAIDVHVAMVPALARHKLPDPVVFIAGGPGQSAIDLAGPLTAQMGRLTNRRDLVFVDQRGTGRSAPLRCEDDGDVLRPLAERVDTAAQVARAVRCARMLAQLPHGDLTRYTTTIAMADLDAVRAALGAPRINLIGASYGTRAVLEYMRLFPQAVRRAVLDGVAPSDMVLPSSFSIDNQAALDALFDWCAVDAVCKGRHPDLRATWSRLLDALPRRVTLVEPFTGRREAVLLTRDAVLGMVRSPLYVPALAAGLPAAIEEAAAERYDALVGLAAALTGPGNVTYSGMHFSVVCAEDLPRLQAGGGEIGAQFGRSFATLYEQVCAHWPRAPIDAGFYTLPRATAATWVLSGAADPATPPRHGARVAAMLGSKARHTVVPNAGHGVMGLACLREAVQRFIDAADDDAALKVDGQCAAAVPHPPVFVPLADAGLAR